MPDLAFGSNRFAHCLLGAAAFAFTAPLHAVVLIDEDFSGPSIPGVFSNASGAALSGGKLEITDPGSGTGEIRLNFSALPAFLVSDSSATPQLRVNYDLEVSSFLSSGATNNGIRFHIQENSAPGTYVNTLGFNFGGRITAGPENPALDHQLVFAQSQGTFAAGGTGNFFVDGDQGTIGHDPSGQGGLGSLWRDFGLANFPNDGGTGPDNAIDGTINVDVLVDTLADTVTTTLTHLPSGDVGVRVDSFEMDGVNIGFGDGGSERFRWRTSGGSVTDGVFTIDNLYIEALPEPTSAALLAAGIGLVLSRRRA